MRKLAHIKNDWQEPHGTQTQKHKLWEGTDIDMTTGGSRLGIRLGRRKFEFSETSIDAQSYSKIERKYRRFYCEVLLVMHRCRTNVTLMRRFALEVMADIRSELSDWLK